MLAAQREKLQKNGAKTGVTMEVDDWVEMAKNMSMDSFIFLILL